MANEAVWRAPGPAQPAGKEAWSCPIAPSNDQTVWVLSHDEAAKLWLSKQEDLGAITADKAAKLWQQWKETWNKWKDYPGVGAAYYSTGQDILTLKKIIEDFGTMFGRVLYKEYGGKPHIILKGYPGLRKVLTGTKYGVNNPKVVAMGIGRAGAMKSIKEGGILTVVLVSAYDVIDYVLTDRATLTDLVGQLASDVTKIAIATGASAASVALLSGTIVTSFALGPLLVAIVVGVGVGIALDAIDNHYKLTEKLKTMLAATAEAVEKAAASAVEQAQQAKQGVIDWAYDAFCALVGRIIAAGEEQAAAYLWRKINDLRWYSVPAM